MASIFDSLRNFFKPKEKTEDVRGGPPHTLVAANGMTFEVEQTKRGGMGIVYICRVISELGGGDSHRLALKTFDEKFFFNVDMSMAVERESAIWARVSDQPFIFPLITVVSIGHKPYLVMPVAEPNERGLVTLADSIRLSPRGLAPSDTLTLALCLSTALAAAAERVPGLVHGDIKPDNILFLGAFPFLADFGLARLTGNSGRGGTPPYMAPELWKEEGRLSLKTDIYAFGATIFEAIAGRPPFSATGNDREQWAALHSSQPPRFDSDDGDQMLEAGLRSLALRCLSKSPADRPEDFKEIKSELFALGVVTEPAVAFGVLQRGIGLSLLAESHKHNAVELRVNTFLEQGQYAEALEALSTVPEEELAGSLLLLAGSTHSLNDDDEKALELFERFLQTGPVPEERVRCLNEVGLSLRRLGRLQEAKTLFENLIEEGVGAARVKARGNYAAILLELDELSDGLRELEWLSRNHPDSHETWALYSLALNKSGDHKKAVDAIQQAIKRAPRNGKYYVSLAELLFRLQRLEESAAALDAAYGLGHHTRDWLKLTIATQMAFGRTDEVNQLVRLAKAQLPGKDIDDVVKEAAALLESFAGGREPAGRVEDTAEAENDAATGVNWEARASGSGDDSDPDAVAAAVNEPAEADAREPHPNESASADKHMEAVRAGRQPHTQVRMSFVDGSFTIDFYFNVESPQYVEVFKNGYGKTKWRMETMSVAERESNYRFARCQNCGFVLLTARDEAERFECKACGKRGPVSTIGSERLDALSAECNRAVGRRPEESSEGYLTLFTAFWVDEPTKAQAVIERMTAEGFKRAVPEAAAFAYFQSQIGERGVEVSSALTQVWYKPITKAEEGGSGHTPPFLDRIIRDLRRKTGTLISASQVMPDANMTEFLLSDPEGRVKIVREQVAANPHDTELKGRLVAAELVAGNLEEARRLASLMEVTDPNDVHALRAAAEVALAEKRPAGAAPRLERLIEASPRDQTARIMLIEAYYELGDEAKVAEHLAQYTALGGQLPKKAAEQ